MSIQAVANLITVFSARGIIQHRFQNAKVGKTMAYNGVSFSYLSFIYQGAAKNRTGDNIVSSLAMSVNPVSMGHATEAITNKWNVRVDTCAMNPSTFDVSRILTTEFWIASSMGYDTTTVEISLSSSIDAVGLVLPPRVLNETLVGKLPSTGVINVR
jgi:hypothetical protein